MSTVFPSPALPEAPLAIRFPIPMIRHGVHLDCASTGVPCSPRRIPTVFYGRNTSIDTFFEGIIAVLEASIQSDGRVLDEKEAQLAMRALAHLGQRDTGERHIYTLIVSRCNAEKFTPSGDARWLGEAVMVARQSFPEWALSAADTLVDQTEDRCSRLTGNQIREAHPHVVVLENITIRLFALRMLCADRRFDQVYLFPLLQRISGAITGFLERVSDRLCGDEDLSNLSKVTAALDDHVNLMKGLATARIPAWLGAAWVRGVERCEDGYLTPFAVDRAPRSLIVHAATTLSDNAVAVWGRLPATYASRGFRSEPVEAITDRLRPLLLAAFAFVRDSLGGRTADAWETMRTLFIGAIAIANREGTQSRALVQDFAKVLSGSALPHDDDSVRTMLGRGLAYLIALDPRITKTRPTAADEQTGFAYIRFILEGIAPAIARHLPDSSPPTAPGLLAEPIPSPADFRELTPPGEPGAGEATDTESTTVAIQTDGELQTGFTAQFGFTDLRPFQLDLIKSGLRGEDQLIVLATGSGKSYPLWYVAHLQSISGVTVVILPTISLMDWHTDALTRFGIKAARIHSGMTREEQEATFEAVQRGEISILMLSPERVGLSKCKEALAGVKVVRILVDEAHYIRSSLRPAYHSIPDFRKAVGAPPLTVMSGSLSFEAQKELTELFQIGDAAHRVLGTVVRTNIEIESFQFHSKKEKNIGIIDMTREALVQPGTVLIYSATVGDAKQIALELEQAGLGPVALYHGDLESERGREVLLQIASNKFRIVSVTTAAAVGLDPSDVHLGILNGIFSDTEVIAQMIGRVGRNGSPSRVALCYTNYDLNIPVYFLTLAHPTPGKIDRVACDLHICTQYKGGRPVTWGAFFKRHGEEGTIEHAQAEAAVRILARAGKIELDGRRVYFNDHPGLVEDGDHFVKAAYLDALRQREFAALRRSYAFVCAPRGTHWEFLRREFDEPDGHAATAFDDIDLVSIARPSQTQVDSILTTLATRVFDRAGLVATLRGEAPSDAHCAEIFTNRTRPETRMELEALRLGQVIRVVRIGPKSLVTLGENGLARLLALNGTPVAPATTNSELPARCFCPSNFEIVRRLKEHAEFPKGKYKKEKWRRFAREFSQHQLDFFDGAGGPSIAGSAFLAECLHFKRTSGAGIGTKHVIDFLTHFFAEEIPDGTFSPEEGSHDDKAKNATETGDGSVDLLVPPELFHIRNTLPIKETVEAAIVELATHPEAAFYTRESLLGRPELASHAKYERLVTALGSPPQIDLPELLLEVHREFPGSIFGVTRLRSALIEYLPDSVLIEQLAEIEDGSIEPLTQITDHVVEANFSSAKFDRGVVRRSAHAALDAWLLVEADPSDLSKLDDLERRTRVAVADAVFARRPPPSRKPMPSKPSTAAASPIGSAAEVPESPKLATPSRLAGRGIDLPALLKEAPLPWDVQLAKLKEMNAWYSKLVRQIDQLPIRFLAAQVMCALAPKTRLEFKAREIELFEIGKLLKRAAAPPYPELPIGKTVDGLMQRCAELVKHQRGKDNKKSPFVPLSHVDLLEREVVSHGSMIEVLRNSLLAAGLLQSDCDELIAVVIGANGDWKRHELWDRIRQERNVSVLLRFEDEVIQLRREVRSLIADGSDDMLMVPVQKYLQYIATVKDLSEQLGEATEYMTLRSMRMLVRRCRNGEWRDLDFDDRLQESYFALAYCLRRFDPGREQKLSPYLLKSQLSRLNKANYHSGLVRNRADLDAWKEAKRVKQLGGLKSDDAASAGKAALEGDFEEKAKSQLDSAKKRTARDSTTAKVRIVRVEADFQGSELHGNDYTGLSIDSVQAQMERVEIAEVVHTLHEPFRTAILLRFGLFGRPRIDQDEIGDALGGWTRASVSAWTKRGFAIMRATLSRETPDQNSTSTDAAERQIAMLDFFKKAFSLDADMNSASSLATARTITLNHVQAEILLGVLPKICNEPIAVAFTSNPTLLRAWSVDDWTRTAATLYQSELAKAAIPAIFAYRRAMSA